MNGKPILSMPDGANKLAKRKGKSWSSYKMLEFDAI